MATTRGTRAKTVQPSEADEAKVDQTTEEVEDQTPEEAEEAAAVASEDTLNEPQTEGEAQLAQALAEEDTFEAVPSDDDADEAPAKKGQFKILKTGLMVNGRILHEGMVVDLPEELASQSAEDQKASYGEVFFEKA